MSCIIMSVEVRSATKILGKDCQRTILWRKAVCTQKSASRHGCSAGLGCSCSQTGRRAFLFVLFSENWWSFSIAWLNWSVPERPKWLPAQQAKRIRFISFPNSGRVRAVMVLCRKPQVCPLLRKRKKQCSSCFKNGWPLDYWTLSYCQKW